MHTIERNCAIELTLDMIRIDTAAPAVVLAAVYNTLMTEEQVEATPPLRDVLPFARSRGSAEVRCRSDPFPCFEAGMNNWHHLTRRRPMVMDWPIVPLNT